MAPAHSMRLSKEELLPAVIAALANERRAIGKVIALFIEIEETQLHLELACSSMFDFATRKLGMSEGEAVRRIRIARLSARYPAVLEALSAGTVTMSNALLVGDLLTPENVDGVLAEIAQRSKREVLRIIARLSPKPDLPSSIVAAVADSLLPTDHHHGSMTPRSPGRHHVQFMASDELRAKIERAQDLLRHTIPDGDLASVMARAFDALLAQLEKQKFAKSDRPQEHPRASNDSTRITSSARREVVARDGERCSYIGINGERCPARGFLEYDHAVPRAKGGVGTVENTRLRCRAHNQLVAEQVFGRTHMKRCRDRRQQRSPSTEISASGVGAGGQPTGNGPAP